MGSHLPYSCQAVTDSRRALVVKRPGPRRVPRLVYSQSGALADLRNRSAKDLADHCRTDFLNSSRALDYDATTPR